MARETDMIYVFASDPGVNDDASNGYAVGNDWKNSSTGKVFTCVDDTTGAAVWVNVTNAVTGENVVIAGNIVIEDGAVLSPPQVTANQDNYDPVGWRDTGVVQVAFLILDIDGNYNFTGLGAPSPAVRARVTIFNNSASNNITFVNNSGSSDAANRFLSNGNVTINEKEALDFIYSTTESRWIPVTN